MIEYDISNLIALLIQHRLLTEFNRGVFYENHIKNKIFLLNVLVNDVEKYGKIKGEILHDVKNKHTDSFSKYLIKIELEVLPSEKNKLTRLNRNVRLQIKGKVRKNIYPLDSALRYSINMYECLLIL